ncbi:MAG TPA: hypothetical protein DHU78_02260 [Opitutae bacterium]|nr:hypothetical protein [Puniceicoccaceae bacterium]HCY57665.1 hypothetical protein [Opitutae bacterium]|tara:strand:- start:181 stop:654 length:474 start_codon:yes stop_codon:yes gene_type:complete
MKRPFKAIVAVSQNGVIGKNGDLPWRLAEDLKWFKKITMGHVVLMGRKTWDSLPFPLPGRKNWVISRSLEKKEGMQVFGSIEEAEKNLRPEEQIFVIGGGEIYAQTIAKCREIYVTEVLQSVKDGDAFFPSIEEDFKVEEILDENEAFILRRWIRKL